MTEAHTYQLSTAENELGVAIAHSEEGNLIIFCSQKYIYFSILNRFSYKLLGVAMIPISWTQMQCPKTLYKEYRKVAKVVPEHVIAEY